jgi:hypothetical protein
MLFVPLPLPRDEYLLDFTSPASRTQFLRLLERAHEVIELPQIGSRPEAYEAAGRYVLDHCDVLIAIWDGRVGQGRGGTASLVERARRFAVPIAWVHAGNRRPGTDEPTSLGVDQGTLTVEGFS